MPSWVEFAERAVPEFEPHSPATELASVLQRYRADLEAAARAGAEGRVQGLRALAEQAVLATELAKQLDQHPPRPSDEPFGILHAALRALTDRMLAQIEHAGLEIVPLRGAPAAAVAELAEVDSWRYDDRYASERVIEELEVAVLHFGRPLRLGRVVMGAPSSGGQVIEELPRSLARRAKEPSARAPRTMLAGSATIVCPVADCGVENELSAEVCTACLTQLGGYRRLSLFPQVLFNRGLRAARAGNSFAARDSFAAVVLWHPDDVETWNAYALACMECRDADSARSAWEQVLARAPADSLAQRGLQALAGPRVPG